MTLHHITLRDDIRRDPEAKLRAFIHVVEGFGIRNVNQTRFERYGIISGEVDEGFVEDIRHLDFDGNGVFRVFGRLRRRSSPW